MTSKADGYSIPMLDFESRRDKYFFRVQNSVCETDETAKNLLNGRIRLVLSITANKVKA